MASMKDGSFQGSEIPCACAAAMMSVADSSTTLKLSSSWRMIEVFPEPGVPVMMYLFIYASADQSCFSSFSASSGFWPTVLEKLSVSHRKLKRKVRLLRGRDE